MSAILSSQSATPFKVGTTVTMGIVSATGRTNLGLLGGGGYEISFKPMPQSIWATRRCSCRLSGAFDWYQYCNYVSFGGNIGLGFSIPINLARNVMGSLVDKGVVERGAIGVMLEGMSQDGCKLRLISSCRRLVRQVVLAKQAQKLG